MFLVCESACQFSFSPSKHSKRPSPFLDREAKRSSKFQEDWREEAYCRPRFRHTLQPHPGSLAGRPDHTRTLPPHSNRLWVTARRVPEYGGRREEAACRPGPPPRPREGKGPHFVAILFNTRPALYTYASDTVLAVYTHLDFISSRVEGDLRQR